MNKIRELYNSLFFTQGGCLGHKDYWSYSLAGLGQNMVYGIMNSYLMIFYTDIMLIPSTVVGNMFLIAKLWDAINDPIMGSFVDRTRTKWGKMRPYLLWTPIPICISTILLFTAPAFSDTQKIVYMYITYIIWGMIYTVCDVPFWSMSSVLTPNTQERTKLVTFTRFMTGIGMGTPTVLYSLLSLFNEKGMLTSVAGSNKKIYFTVAVISSVLGCILLSLGFFKTKERVEQNSKAPTFKESMKFLFKNKPLMMVLLCNLLAFPKSIQAAMQVYIANYIYGGGKYVLILTIPATIAGFVGYLFVPFMVKKFGAIKAYIIANVYTLIPMGILYFIGFDKLWLTLIFVFLVGLMGSAIGVIPTILIADCVDYMEWMTGQRAEGVSFSIQTFMAKASSALQNWVVGILLAVFAFSKPIENSMGEIVMQTQSATTMSGMWAMYTIIPAAASIFCIIPLLFYDLKGEKLKKIQADLIERRNLRSTKDSELVAEI